MDQARKVKNREISCVGIVKRYDLRSSYESKRIVVNLRLREMCKKKGIGFVEYDPDFVDMARDKLHLNEQGQHGFAKKILNHCVFL